MVKVDITSEAVRFRHGDVEVGRYVLDDPFKPYLHPLRSVDGDIASLAMAHDHRHHKGLMFSLQTDRANFWEETPRESAPVVGRQIGVGIHPTKDNDAVGFEQTLEWRSDAETVFTEVRRVLCTVANETVIWHWSTRLQAKTDVTLEQSEWSAALPGGGKVNYHGLGLRFPRALEVAGDATSAVIDATTTSPEDALGSTAHEVGISGPLDGTWPPRRIEVRFRQIDRSDTFFTLGSPLTYLAVGPSNFAATRMSVGDELVIRVDVSVSAGIDQNTQYKH